MSIVTQLFSPFANVFNRLVNPNDQTTPFNLQSLERFPFTEWSSMQEYYQTLINWYDGVPLTEQIVDPKTGKSVDKFPIKLNPIPGSCEKHAAVLFGNTLESIREGGLPVQFIPSSKTTESARVAMKEAIKKSFEWAGGGSMFADAGITSQYMGGSVWRVRFDIENEDCPVPVETVDPSEFFGVPNGSNPWEIMEAWFVREISQLDAEDRGYTRTGREERYFYAEHWMSAKVKIYINDQVVSESENAFGIVPFVYIPHMRVRGFIGKSMITEAIKGIVREWNLRFADVGDAVSEDAHSVLAVRGVRGSLSELNLPDGRKAVNLGSKSGLGQHETDPDLISVNTKSVSEPMIKLNESLKSEYRKEAKHPAVADGEDEGSQRSAATLVARMWPMIAHVELERVHWTTGLLKLVKMILMVYAIKGLDGITEDLVNTEFTVKWSSALPRDRELLVNELAIRKKNEMISLFHALELFGDVVDVDAEIALIAAEAEEKHKQEMEAMELKGKLQGKGNADGKNNQESGDETNVDASNQIKSEE